MYTTNAIFTLPGNHLRVSDSARCDNHEDRLAVFAVQGETDSMGCEVHELCDECHAQMLAEIKAEREQLKCCDWCKSTAKVRPYRDSDEGMSGPVYEVCGACISKDQENLRAYLQDGDGYDGFDDDFHDTDGWDDVEHCEPSYELAGESVARVDVSALVRRCDRVHVVSNVPVVYRKVGLKPYRELHGENA